MQTKFRITVTTPTNYTVASIRHFGIPLEKRNFGRPTAIKDFNSEEEAKNYLIERAENYYDGHVDNNDEKLNDAIQRIENHGSIYLDAAYGSIEEIED